MKIRTQIHRFLARKRSRAKKIRKELLPSNVYTIIMDTQKVISIEEQERLNKAVNEQKTALITRYNEANPDWQTNKELCKAFDIEHKEILQKHFGHL